MNNAIDGSLTFHQHFSTPKGSAGIRSYGMAQKLIKQGHKVTMVCGSYDKGATGLTSEFKRGKRTGDVDGIDIIEFDLAYSNADGFLSRSITFLKFAFRSISIALTTRYDLVFATSTPLTAGIPGIFARWLKRKPFVFEVRDLWPELPKAMGVITSPVILTAMSVLEWVTYKSANKLVGLSPGIVQGIERHNIKSKDVALIPNGYDLNIFSGEIEHWRPNTIKDTDFLAIFTGTHGIANGLDAVLDAAAELQKRNRDDIKLLLVGQGRLKPALQQRAKEENLRNIVFHDPIDKEQLARLMASADIGMQVLANVPAFYYGTSPNKFFDYISAGLPVLNNYPGWLAEMIEEHRCGLTVEPENPKAFADALIKAADNKQELKAMGKRAQKLAQEKFDRVKLGQKFVKWLEQAV